MTTSYSSTPLATNDVAYKPKLLDVSNQQPSEVKTDTSFSQKLKQALTPDSQKEPVTEQVASSAQTAGAVENGVGITDIAPAAMDIGLGLATGNPIQAGLAGADLMQTVLKADIEKQFTELGQGIAAALVAGLSGDPSATQVLPTAEELAEQAALASAEIVNEGGLQVAAANQSAAGLIGTSQEGKSVPTKGSVPKAMLEAQANINDDELLDPNKPKV
ncbi:MULTISPECIES: hypothetical protein [unclassified Agarivorans]|uniref:hypothetical protein n=1 Tax=unclassified Agarivorans TaxID=2636026 RepID=UPI0026E17771|nr:MULTISPECIES: hypothetical protein [unclassified Agarivorans]MDO6687825.1 hypothetical protein [Agarivorans sp. 3_MG-2023]MDO6717447.1 hypothetical protein [Agarivorans sp. 2_MG-2023]